MPETSKVRTCKISFRAANLTCHGLSLNFGTESSEVSVTFMLTLPSFGPKATPVEPDRPCAPESIRRRRVIAVPAYVLRGGY